MINSTGEKIIKRLAVFTAGGLSYGVLELVWRGYSHISMFFVGGLCFLIIGSLDERSPAPCLLYQAAVSCAVITSLEFVSGVTVNLVLKLNVWDYSYLPMNILGQVCLPYSLLWFVLSIPAIYYEDFLRRVLFDEKIPKFGIIPKLPALLQRQR